MLIREMVDPNQSSGRTVYCAIHVQMYVLVHCPWVKNSTGYISFSASLCVLILSVYNVVSPLQSNVYMYYGLSNFYQNHRRYVKSRDDSQLNGDLSALKVGSFRCGGAENPQNASSISWALFAFCRTPVRNVSHTAPVKDNPLHHVGP